MKKDIEERTGANSPPFSTTCWLIENILENTFGIEPKRKMLLAIVFQDSTKEEEEVIRIPNAMPQIVSDDLFNRVQAIIQSRKEVRRANGKRK